jgi:hypothetical protein
VDSCMTVKIVWAFWTVVIVALITIAMAASNTSTPTPNVHAIPLANTHAKEA